jgi:hypothetical protein
VRTDSYDKLNELSEPLIKKKEQTKVSSWKYKIVGNDNNDKNLEKNNFPQLR